MRRLDLPPLWLLLSLAVAWALGRWDPWGLTFGGPVPDLLAGLLVGGGLVLIAVATSVMRRHRTAILPRREASRVVTDGPFARSRNPIYLGMALILAGGILWADAPLALPLLPLWVWVIERRFIRPEEDGLRRRFHADWARYAARTRRWL